MRAHIHAALLLAYLSTGCEHRGTAPDELVLGGDGGIGDAGEFESTAERLRTGAVTDPIEGIGQHPASGCPITLVTPNLSITAAHCLEGHAPTGELILAYSWTRPAIHAFARHPNFVAMRATEPWPPTERFTNPRWAAVDFAVIRHDAVRVRPIAVGGAGPTAPDSLRLASWHRHARNGRFEWDFNVGRADPLPAFRNSDGLWLYRMQLRDADACNGDSGGPFLRRAGSRWEVMSVLADWIENPASTGTPGVGCHRRIQGPLLSSGPVGTWLRSEMSRACRALPASEPACRGLR